jgi:hypothetical protein
MPLILEATSTTQKEVFNDEASSSRKNIDRHQESRQAMQTLKIQDGFSGSVTDLTLIGHGSIGDFWMDDGGHCWQDVSELQNIWKKGKIFQRVCGQYALENRYNRNLRGIRSEKCHAQ